MRRHQLSEMSWEDAREVVSAGGAVVLLPIGSTEQHGRHLPLGTDTYAAIDLTERAAELTGAVVAPPLWYGMSGHHMELPGTMTVRPEILLEFVYDMIRSLASGGFSRFVLVNGHRIANIPWMQLVCERAEREIGGCRTEIFDPAYMSREIGGRLGFGPVGHADEIETSHLLVSRPDLVDMARAEDHPAEEIDLYHVDPREAKDTLAYVARPMNAPEETGGVKGSPSRANREKGECYRDHLVRRLVAVIERMRRD
ncbi:MAG: creatininase family protein [Bacillota bacterium]